MSFYLLVVSVVLFLAFLLVTWAFINQRKRRAFKQSELNYIHAHWVRILDLFQSHHRDAIMDADKLLDYALSCQGFQGSLGEKLKRAGPRFSSLNGVWRAHKLRNSIAHELGGVSGVSGGVSQLEARQALAGFKRALNDLGAKL